MTPTQQPVINPAPPGILPPRPPVAERLEPGLRRVLAPNPSALTYWGTNTYVLGEGAVAVIDPGPADPAHLEAILAVLAPGERVAQIVVTHAHMDHSPLARPLAQRTGAPVLAFGDAQAGLNPALARLGASLGSSEGVDRGFAPDAVLADGEVLGGDGWQLRALHTPGHLGNHICLVWDDIVFSGDHVMGWSTSIVSPPDGDMGAYMASLGLLATVPARRLMPGHGQPVETPAERIAELTTHRRGREAQVIAALAAGPATPDDIARRCYTDIPAPLLPAAARNVLAHLLDLQSRNLVTTNTTPGPAAAFRLP